MNESVEVTNWNIKKIMQKRSLQIFHGILSFALYGFKNAIHTSLRATSFSSIYGMKAILPMEVKI